MEHAYGLADAPRLWKLTIYERLFKFEVSIIPVLPKLFLIHKDQLLNQVMMVKFIDDLLLKGEEDDVNHFLTELEKRFKVGRIIEQNKLIYNKLSIEQHEEVSIAFSME